MTMDIITRCFSVPLDGRPGYSFSNWERYIDRRLSGSDSEPTSETKGHPPFDRAAQITAPTEDGGGSGSSASKDAMDTIVD